MAKPNLVYGISQTPISFVAPEDLNNASFNNANLTGTPTAPTQDATDSSTAVANTAFVQRAIDQLIGSAPEARNTLLELSQAIDANSDVSVTLSTAITQKVDKEEGKQLSTNDYTTAEKTKLANIEDNANNYILPAATSSELGGIKVGSNLTYDSSTGVIELSYADVTDALGGIPVYNDSLATDSALGLVKLNQTTGQNVDGTMSQKAISDALDTKFSTDTTITNVLQIANQTDNEDHAILLTTNANQSGNVSGSVQYNSNVKVNLSTGLITGTITQAQTLETARNIDGMSFNGSNAINRFAVCNTAANEQNKVATCSAGTFVLEAGARVTVKFVNGNTVNAPTLNVNGTGAKALMYRGSAMTAGALAENSIYDFVYTGTDYEVVGSVVWTN